MNAKPDLSTDKLEFQNLFQNLFQTKSALNAALLANAGQVLKCVLIFWSASVAAHHYDSRHEFGDDFDQIRLGSHDVVDVLISPWDFVQTTGQQPNVLTVKMIPPFFPVKILLGFGTRHTTTSAM